MAEEGINSDVVVPLRRGQDLQFGGGGGNYGDMEARIKRLDDRMDGIEPKLDDLTKSVARMEGEMKRLPGYPGLFVICATLVGVVSLVVRFL